MVQTPHFRRTQHWPLATGNNNTQHAHKMASRNLALLCIITAAARVLGFALQPLGVASRAGAKPFQVRDAHHVVQLQRKEHQRHVTPRAATTRLAMSDDFDGNSFGVKAMQERTNAELQEMLDSHNILAFIKVKHARLAVAAASVCRWTHQALSHAVRARFRDPPLSCRVLETFQ